MMKMRQDSEDQPLFKKGKAEGLFGEVVSNSKLMVEGLTQNTQTAFLQ